MSVREYPTWVCQECATAAGGHVKLGQISTWHLGKCDICDEKKDVTEPRDFGYPDFGIGAEQC